MDTLAPCLAPRAGWLFQVMPDSVQLLAGTARALSRVAVVAVWLPNRRSFADPTVQHRKGDSANLMKERRLFPTVLVFLTCRVVAVPKLLVALAPSRT